MRKPDSVNPALMAALGARVRRRREAIEPNQAAFAEAVGYDRNLWGRIERGLQNVSISTLGRVAAALNTPMAELLDGIETESAAAHRPGPASEAPDGKSQQGVE